MRSATIFVVEDEILIRMMLAEMITGLGHRVIAEPGDLQQATRLAEAAAFDMAILDVAIGCRGVTPVADALVARGLPFIFSSGYGQDNLPRAYRDRPVLQKPFTICQLAAAISATLGDVEAD